MSPLSAQLKRRTYRCLQRDEYSTFEATPFETLGNTLGHVHMKMRFCINDIRIRTSKCLNRIFFVGPIGRSKGTVAICHLGHSVGLSTVCSTKPGSRSSSASFLYLKKCLTTVVHRASRSPVKCVT